MPNLYTYAALIQDKAKEKQTLALVREIIENDIILPTTARHNRQRIKELRNAGEDRLADAITKDYAEHFT